jgi:hypothetical protein
MVNMWKPDTYKIAELIDDVSNSDLVLPQFQRLPVWGRTDWIPFLTTVLLNRPTGTLLLLEVGKGVLPFAVRSLDGAPVLPKGHTPRYMLLDGQQRSTTLFSALRSGFRFGRGGSKDFLIDVTAALDSGELSESHLALVPRNGIKGFAELAQSGKVTLGVLFDSALRTPWLSTYAETAGMEMGVLINQLKVAVPGFETLREYQFPVLKISDTTPLDVVVDIFEGMNRRGQRLNQFDLMVARLYEAIAPKQHYDLRQRWQDALSNSPNLALMGVSEHDGMLPLQLIALQVSRLPHGARPPSVKGLTSRDVLYVPTGFVRGSGVIKGLSLESAVSALEAAAEFLKTKCGVRSHNLLPQISMLLPIADQLLPHKSERLDDASIRRWFFSAGLAIDYYGSVNSYAQRDCDALTKWAQTGEVPSSVARLNAKAAENLDLKQQMTREGSILGKTVMALLISAGAKDWCPGGLQLKDVDQPVDFHHMLPAKALKRDLGVPAEALNPIAGFTPLTASCNRSLGEQRPQTTIAALQNKAAGVFKSHHLDVALLAAGLGSRAAVDAFLGDREERLRKFVVQELGL